MGFKFGRTYQLSVGTVDIRIDPSGAPILIALPFTIEFEVTRNILYRMNTLHLRVYNLSPRNRNLMRFNYANVADLRPITLSAGYGDGVIPEIFTGNITQAWSVREGANFVTTIEAHDAGFAFANSQTNQAFPTNTPQLTIMSTLAKSMAGFQVSSGAIGSYPGNISRGNTYIGSTTDLLNTLSNGGFYIDNRKVYCLGNNECAPGGIPVIDSASGLLGTPVLQETTLSFEMLFEPGLIAGQKVQLVSSTDASFNGVYKVSLIRHRGTISAAVCGDAVTSVEMYAGTAALAVADIV